MFKSFLFRHSKRIANAARNNPPLAKGEKSNGVALLQTALLKLGYKMPVSTARNAIPDGIFGDETKRIVAAFQTENKLKADGIAGQKTLARLDELIAKDEKPPMPRPPRPKPIPPQPPKPKPPGPRPPQPQPQPSPNPSPAPAPTPSPFKPPEDEDFTVGTGNPTLGHDDGAGPWNSKPKEIGTRALHAMMAEGNFLTASTIVIGDDAVKHLIHYNNNSGKALTVDVAGMINEVPSTNKLYKTLAALIQAYIEKFPPGTYDITSKHTWGGYNQQGENRNWFFAVGGFSAWIKGKVSITQTNGVNSYDFDGGYHFYDRYNWDGGKHVEIAGIVITDEAMGEFHRQGLSMEYDEVGSCAVRFRWVQGSAPPPSQLDPVSGR